MKTMPSVALMMISIVSLISTLPAESLVDQWERRYEGPASSYDAPTALATDKEGNVVVVGFSRGNSTADDYYTAKYAATTGALLWEKRYNGPANGADRPLAVAVDSEGNPIVTGGSVGSGGTVDIYTAKYAAADGALIWQQRFDGPSNLEDYPRAVLVDSLDNVIVTGTSTDDATYDDFYTAKYAKADGALLWEKRYSPPGHFTDYVSGMALDSEGNVFVTGTSSGVNASADYYTLKYAAANGAVLWEKRYNGPDNPYERAQAIAVDSAGNAIVTGYVSTPNVSDILTIKYAAENGAQLWERRYDGPMHHADAGRGVAVDKAGNVFVTGSSYTQSTGNDYYTAKYAEPCFGKDVSMGRAALKMKFRHLLWMIRETWSSPAPPLARAPAKTIILRSMPPRQAQYCGRDATVRHYI